MNQLYKQLTVFCLLVTFFFHSEQIVAQDFLRSSDLSKLKVETLSDTDITKLKAELKKNNVAIENVESLALSKGMNSTEFSKLKDRVNKNNSNQSPNKNTKKDKGDKKDAEIKKSYNSSRNQNNSEKTNSNKELKVIDVLSTNFNTYKPQSGDVFTISKILNRYENRVTIKRVVFHSNDYSLAEGMTISDLITKADGLTEDTYSNRVYLVRLKPDLTKEIVDINLKRVLLGDASYNIKLKKEDKLIIYYIFDLGDNFSAIIDGEIRNPGTYDYVENILLNDLLIQADGLSDAASKRVEIVPMIKLEHIDPENPKKNQLFDIEITPEDHEQSSNIFILKPYDIINDRKMPVFEMSEMITVSGKVLYPGKYVIANKKEKIFDFI